MEIVNDTFGPGSLELSESGDLSSKSIVLTLDLLDETRGGAAGRIPNLVEIRILSLKCGCGSQK